MASPTDDRQSINEPDQRLKLAERLKAAREYLGFSQDQVAQFLGIARSALSNIETGQRRVEAVELSRLATLYKKPVTYFTSGGELTEDALPSDVAHLARKVSALSKKDRDELSRFADFLKSRGSTDKGK